jgi:mono/diheme cytochrome c family protein
VLGFSALQLSPDRDPMAPHAEVPSAQDVNLSTLARDGRLRGLPADLLERAPRIDAPTPRARAALGYLHANCGTCHTDDSRIAGLDLRLDAGPATSGGAPRAIATTLGRESRWRLPGAQGLPSLRVVPGDPRHSVLFRRAASRNPLVQMPPLGTNLVDAEGVALLESWIRDDLAPATVREPLPPISSSLETVR